MGIEQDVYVVADAQCKIRNRVTCGNGAGGVNLGPHAVGARGKKCKKGNFVYSRL